MLSSSRFLFSRTYSLSRETDKLITVEWCHLRRTGIGLWGVKVETQSWSQKVSRDVTSKLNTVSAECVWGQCGVTSNSILANVHRTVWVHVQNCQGQVKCHLTYFCWGKWTVLKCFQYWLRWTVMSHEWVIQFCSIGLIKVCYIVGKKSNN